jgi:hypothetical protein
MKYRAVSLEEIIKIARRVSGPPFGSGIDIAIN